jgi:hypothetical protein
VATLSSVFDERLNRFDADDVNEFVRRLILQAEMRFDRLGPTR